MHPYLLSLSCAIFLFVALPSLAQDRNISGANLYKSTVSAAKLQAQPQVVAPQVFDEKSALSISQNAIGNRLGDYTFHDRSGRTVRLSDYRGKPLVISLIYTQCPIICATVTRSLSAIRLSQDALGANNFGVLTVGFDTENDTPKAMGDFAKRMDVDLPNWEFVSADPDTIKKLSKDLGFTYFPSDEGGFNHITQTTFVDRDGKVYQHIYGDEFASKTLLQPLRDMIFNIKTAESGFARLSNRVRALCTVYDSKAGKYKTDYSYFYGIGMSLLCSLLIIWWLVSEYRRSPKRNYPDSE
ncbi:MAG: SCO family protein [Gallionella sp.]|nr:SCO family protein [Gallionella sp.]